MKVGILLITLGGPKTTGEIPEFITRFIGRELPPPALRGVIERYKLIGGFSPLCDITAKQTDLLNDLLNATSSATRHEFLCLPAFRYASPFIEESMDVLFNSDIDRMVLFILSPFFTTVTTGNYINTAKAYIERIQNVIPVQIIHSWHDEPLFIESWCAKIKNEKFDLNAFYLFSAHSLPEKYAREPYKAQIEKTMNLVAGSALLKNYGLGWQSIPGNAAEPWIGPTVEKVMDEIVEKGFKKVIQVPIGFTADHIETLYDIDITHKKYAQEKGLEFYRVSSLNADTLFISALKQMLLNAIEKDTI
jgi:ferrochelatase